MAKNGMLKYRVIYGDLKNGIESGVYLSGARLPSESVLCRQYDVQRDTVRHALELLVREGLIVKQPGRGSFVCSKDQEIQIAIDPAHLQNPVISEFLQRLSKK